MCLLGKGRGLGKYIIILLHLINDYLAKCIKLIVSRQNLIADNDGIMDASSMFASHLVPINNLYNSLFKTIATLLSWEGLQLEQYKDTLDSKLSCLVEVKVQLYF